MGIRHFGLMSVGLVLTMGAIAGVTGEADAQPNGNGSSAWIAPTADTTIPVYDTAWQMLSSASEEEADEYFAALRDHGFTGAWTGVIHHIPVTYVQDYRDGGPMGALIDGEVVLTDGYIAHANRILDAAHRNGMKVGLVVAWHNLYLPGGRSGEGNEIADQVRGTVTVDNAYAYGLQMVEAFGDHPAVSMWVFGGDGGSNNTEANKEVWRIMARAVRDAGSPLDIAFHAPPFWNGSLFYAGEPWIDVAAPEIGHDRTIEEAEEHMRLAVEAYGVPVFQGEAKYFNSNFDWLDERWRNPGVTEVRAEAIASRNAGVSGYLYGDAGRWHWCRGYADTTPCDRANIADSFGAGEAAVIEVFSQPSPPPTTTTTTTTTTSVAPAPVAYCDGLRVTVDLSKGQTPTPGDDVILGTNGPDIIDGGTGDDVICGLDGDDRIWGGGGSDRIFGHRGDDRIGGNKGHDVIYGGHGHDRLRGGPGHDTLDGAAGYDRLVGDGDNDRLTGGNGRDRLIGSGGHDVLLGGAGIDLLAGGGGRDSGDAGADFDRCAGLETVRNCEAPA